MKKKTLVDFTPYLMLPYMLAFAIIKYFFLAISTPLVHNIEIYLIFLLLILPSPTSDQ